MALELIQKLMETSNAKYPNFPPTLIYNEGWLLRIILDWFSSNETIDYLLSFSKGARWFSEAYLPSAFLPRFRGDPLSESSTHLDGVIGHFSIGNVGEADLSLLSTASQFIALEAKIFSGLSSGTKNAKYYDQAARNVACIAEILKRANRQPTEIHSLGFYVLAPQSQIDKGIFTSSLNKESINQKVGRRVREYQGGKDQWYLDWFLPTLERIDIRSISWEDIIVVIIANDEVSGLSISDFYEMCLKFNQ